MYGSMNNVDVDSILREMGKLSDNEIVDDSYMEGGIVTVNIFDMGVSYDEYVDSGCAEFGVEFDNLVSSLGKRRTIQVPSSLFV